MGVVYEAYDRERDEIVALKQLLAGSLSTPYRFKKEFRTLTDLIHPNLVTLYELFVEEDQCFFTMELLDGVTFAEHVRPSNALPERAVLDLAALGPALRQLAEGVFTLHEAGIVHRDFKPSNVMVTTDGRVVILDFGLATEFAPIETLVTVERGLSGTLAYMAPELIQGGRPGPASDWYSVGVMLYEVLVGHLPFAGNLYEMLLAKQQNPVAIESVVPGLPVFLTDLCMDLLAKDPEMRPTGQEVLRRTGSTGRPIATEILTADARIAFVGRGSELSVMQGAFETVERGSPVSLYVYGASGMGKSALVHQFLSRLRESNRTLNLAGRCYEREWIPFKALDGVVDNLRKHLMYLPRQEVDSLLPADIHALARLFPAMMQIESIARAPEPKQQIPDPLALRRRAFSAFRELLRSLSERETLVIQIDDFHWADPDSTVLIEDLLRPPNPPPFLLIITFRSEEIEAKPFLQALLDEVGTETCIGLPVKPLADDEVRELIASLLPPDRVLAESIVDSIVREAVGSPFLVEQLGRHLVDNDPTGSAAITLGDMLDARMARLPAEARRLLETVSVAGRPLDYKVASGAAGVTSDERRLVAMLRSAHLLRATISARLIEPYHDRIRETVAKMLDPAAVRAMHEKLAQTLTAHGFDDPEALFEHYLAAGRHEDAAAQASLAAQKASGALAFDRAVLYYHRAIELGHPDDDELIELETKLAEALVNAGQVVEAARVYLETARRLPAGRALAFRQRAAAQLLVGGHIDEGIEVMRDVLSAVGLRLPASPRTAFASLLVRRAWLRLRGLKFVQRDPLQTLEKDRLRLDACWSVAIGLAIVDTIRGNDFLTRYLLLAFRTGEPYWIARGLALEASAISIAGQSSRNRAAQVLAAAENLAQTVNNPHLTGLLHLAKAGVSYFVGEWKKSMELFQRAEEIFRDSCTGVTWELTAAQFFQAGCLQHFGQLGTVFHHRLATLAAAQARGNLFTEIHFRIRLSVIWLAADDPGQAEREVTDAIRRWSHKGFHIQHFTALVALTQADLYQARAASAYSRVESEWSSLSWSLLMRVQILRIEANYLRARCALAAAQGAADSRSYLKVAEKQARRLAREKGELALPFVSLIQAAIAYMRGDHARSAGLLATAITDFERLDMSLYAAAAKRRLGQVLGNSKGPGLIDEVDDWMRREKIVKPEFMTRMLVPGFESR
jgi:tetratricopeptide (TPR) repeat protein